MSARDHEHPKPQEHNRPPIEAAKHPVPGASRVRGPEERTPGEDVLGEDIRARDELVGEDRSSPDQLLQRARAAAPEIASDRIAELERKRMKEMGVHQEGGGSGGTGGDISDEPGFRGAEEPAGSPGFRDLEEPEDAPGFGGEQPRSVPGTTKESASHGARTSAQRTHAQGLGRTPVREREGEGEVSDVPAGREGASAIGRGRPAADEELGRAETSDPEAIERREAWEHVPDLERTSNELESGEGEARPVAVTRPVDRASFDEQANAAYDEDIPGAGTTQDQQERTASVPAPGPATAGRAEIEPPPQSVIDVERAEPAAEEGAAPKKRARRTKKAAAEGGDAAARPRRTSRRSSQEAKKTPKKKAPGAHEADANP